MKSNKIADLLWASFLLIIAPFRGILRAVCKPFICQPQRSMENEIVLVTGAAQGMGRGMALEFAKLGATVVCWDINEHGCQETAELAKKVSNGKAPAFSYVCDISKRDEVAAVARQVQTEVGEVSILVNNAGIVTAGRLDSYQPETISRVVATNYTSHFWTIEAFLPHMKAVDRGQIVCISSMSSLTPPEYLVPYASTKCAVSGLMDALDEELISLGYKNIKLTTVLPFFTATSGLQQQLKKSQPEKNSERMEAMETSQVVKDIVGSVVMKKREFTVPGYLLAGTQILKLYPRDVRRAWKQVFLGNWRFYFTGNKEQL
ncbi:estradiol 17-beta-dehydrogenase 11-like [Ischnura elegans]|uniref:estradiol 17-beta-dehydrogenase 11-like n=1 Tax=Ischnura elegans TaxID=197161 RepID=UPI001ED8A924|nr:estradiol 17-beta-dehydrogenase 11-like [Ischnura elegans]